MPPSSSKRAALSIKKQKRPKQVKNGLKKNSYNVAEAKTHLSEILEHVEETGEEVVLTRRGKPIARVIPGSVEDGARQLGFARGQVKLLPGWNEPVTLEEFLGD